MLLGSNHQTGSQARKLSFFYRLSSVSILKMLGAAWIITGYHFLMARVCTDPYITLCDALHLKGKEPRLREVHLLIGRNEYSSNSTKAFGFLLTEQHCLLNDHRGLKVSTCQSNF